MNALGRRSGAGAFINSRMADRMALRAAACMVVPALEVTEQELAAAQYEDRVGNVLEGHQGERLDPLRAEIASRGARRPRAIHGAQAQPLVRAPRPR